MRNPWLFLAVCAVILLACVKNPQQAGTMSETDTAMIFNPDNTPAVGAVVRFFVATDSTRTVSYQAMTDTNGRYSVTGLAKGSYNMLATKDTFIVYQDLIFADTDTVFVKPDTLQKSGSVIGIIGLQPNHDPRTATVQVLGTNLYSNVDKDGRFTLSPIAKGNYNLRLVTTLPDYTPTYITIHTQGQKKDTLADTLWLTFTGIPVVTDLAASYDSVNGLVHVSWNKAAYRDFQNYLVYRDAFESINLSTNPIAACADTFFSDAVFKRNLGSGKFSFSDTNDYHFKYRVCIENNSAKPGDTYKYIGIVAASPKKVETSFVFTFFHAAKQVFRDSASINDTLLCYGNLSNPTRQLKRLVWTDVNAGKTIRTITLDSTKKIAYDTLKYSWNTVGDKKLACVVTDMAGTVWRDTARVFIVKGAPVVTMYYSPAAIAVNDTFHIRMNAFDKYGKIVNVEWDIGKTGQFLAGPKVGSVIIDIDTAIVAPGMPDTGFLCVVRVTDDDGNVVLDSVKINVGIFKLATDSADFSTREGHSSVVFNNKIWVIAGDYSSTIWLSDAWYSEDGILWLPATRQAAFKGRVGQTSLVYNNEMWVIGGLYSHDSLMNDVWFSSDGGIWTQSTSAAQFSPRCGHASVSFNNKMWVIGGVGYQGPNNLVYYNDVWYSTDGATWVQATANAGFSPRRDYSSLVFNNKIWVIAGDCDSPGHGSDVWYSEDGITWIQATANAGFSPRHSHSSLVFDNKMWVIAGEDYSGGLLSDAWYSTDGIIWTKITTNAGFSPRGSHTSVVFDNKM
jgi:hypothetical protein